MFKFDYMGEIMSEYKELTKSKYVDKTIELLETLPEFCSAFYDKRQLRLAPKSQYDYATKMKMFLHFLKENHPHFKNLEMTEITPADMALVTTDDAANFVSYIKSRKARANSFRKNSDSTADNYVACISTYYTFMVKQGMIEKSPFLGIDRQKKKKKEIIYLDETEQSQFMNTVTSGNGLSPRKRVYYEKNQIRDICIIQILIDTGIRVSELVGLDIDDINFKNCSLYVQRKTDKAGIVYFSDQTKDIIQEYLDIRSQYHPDKEEKALILSSSTGARMTERTIERRVKDFAKAAGVPNADKITPHKLRSTYAMDMLRYTGSLALVQSQLGHENISTTQIYAQTEESKKAMARNLRITQHTS